MVLIGISLILVSISKNKPKNKTISLKTYFQVALFINDHKDGLKISLKKLNYDERY